MEHEEFQKKDTHPLDYVQLIWRKKWLVVLVALMVFGILMWRNLRIQPLYEAAATVQVGITVGSLPLDRLAAFAPSTGGMESEIEILKSRVIGERTAVKLARHYVLKPLPPGVALELTDVETTDKAKSGVYSVTFSDSRGEYRVSDPEGRLIGIGKPDQEFRVAGVSFTISKVSAKPETNIQILVHDLPDVGNALRRQLSVSPIRGTNIINLKVSAGHPQEAARLANGFSEAYVDYTSERTLQQMTSMRRFLDRQIDAYRQDMLRTEKALVNKGGDPKSTDELVIREGLGSGTDNPKFEFTRRLFDLELRRLALLGTYTSNHRVFAELDRQIAKLRSLLTKDSRVRKDDVEENRVRATTFAYLLQKQQEVRLAEAAGIGSARIIDRAIPPKHPVGPDVSASAKRAIMFGLLAGIGFVLLLSYLDRSIKNVKDIEDRVGLPVFGTIPKMLERGRLRQVQYLSDERMLPEPLKLKGRMRAGSAAAQEAYRSLRTNIQFAIPEAPVRWFLFTSAGRNEGKSITVANLAMTISQTDKRILVLDADLRRPVQHRLFGSENEIGLADVLAGRVAWAEVTKPTMIKNLDLIPSGKLPPNPVELLAGQVMRDFLEEAKQQYDQVLVDSPPVLLFTDACVLAPLLSGVFIVVRTGLATPEAVVRAQSLLGGVNARVVGTILNAFPQHDGFGYYGYPGYPYRDGYDSEDDYRKRIKRKAQQLLSYIKKTIW